MSRPRSETTDIASQHVENDFQERYLCWDPIIFLQSFNQAAYSAPSTRTAHDRFTTEFLNDNVTTPEWPPWNETMTLDDWLNTEAILLHHPLQTWDHEEGRAGTGALTVQNAMINMAAPVPALKAQSNQCTVTRATSREGSPAQYLRSRIIQASGAMPTESGNSRRCCMYMHKSHHSLLGPLPSHEETLAYLENFFGVSGTDPNFSLSSRCWDSSSHDRPRWRPICLLVIWESPKKGLTTEGIYQALIKAAPYCRQRADESKPPKGKKPTGWAASVAALLSKECIFTQRAPGGGQSLEWRIDIRGAGYHTTRCKHQSP